MSEPRKWKYMELSEIAELLGMNKGDLIKKMRTDGFISGNTQSKKARKLRLFYVDQGVVRCSSGLYHKNRLNIRVTEKGKAYFMKLYRASPELLQKV